MSNRCIAPSEILDVGTASQFGGVAESIIESDYLTSVGRTTVFPASKIDFIDFQHGFGNIPLTIAFLKSNNPTVSAGELAVLAAGGGLKVADIITHNPPARTEFYEIKPNSADGVLAGRTKVALIGAMMAGFSLPYTPGIQYRPDKRIRFFSGMPLGSRLDLFFHFKWIQPGLIVYEICAEGDLEELGLKVLIAIIAAAILTLILAPILFPAAGAAAVLAVTEKQGVTTGAYIAGSVGPGGSNHSADVRFVQRLLNDTRVHDRQPRLAVDGIAGPKTDHAIMEYQRNHGLVADGRIDVNERTLRHLINSHLASLQAGVTMPYITDSVLGTSQSYQETYAHVGQLIRRYMVALRT